MSRTGGLKIVKINASTGDSVGTLDIVGISGGTFSASLIDVTPDGRIFASNLTTSATTNPYKIYTWENESASPVVAYSGSMNDLALRFGDSFRVDWTDGAMNVYAGGSNNPNLAKFTWTGESLVLSNVFNYGPVNNTTMRAVRAIAPIAGEDSLWVNEYAYTLKKISTETGQIGSVVPASLFPTAEAISTDFVEINNRKLVAVFPSSLIASGQSAQILDLGFQAPVGSTMVGVNSNGNGAGMPIFDAANNRLFLLATNNHIASYDISELLKPYVNVKFTVNTATIRDTVQSTDLVQIRGVVNGLEHESYLGQTFNWGSGSVRLDNAGGDYWSMNLRLHPGDELRYKIYTAKRDGSDGWIDHSGGGWESSDEQIFTVPLDAGSEYVAPIVYFNRVLPFEPKTDSVALFFRVNVGSQSAFGLVNADSKVGLRGTPSVLRNPQDWSSTNVYLQKEPDIEGNLNVFYSGVHYVPVSFAGVPFIYKFVIESDGLTTWEDGSDRYAIVSQSDSTYNTVFFSNRRPPERAVIEANLLFKVDVGALEELGL
ncbi:MAG: DUF4623 domain-containing protein, partial [Synechococcus sp.]|nr:DUF4623 domain-containing protein [Synechococcus sp.]